MSGTSERSLTVLFDFGDPYSYLALAPTWQLIEDTGVSTHWYPFLGKRLRPPQVPDDPADRSAMHRLQRARYAEIDLCRYARARQLPARHFADGGLYRGDSGELAAMSFNWATGEGAPMARDFLQRVFLGYWDGDLELDSVEQIGSLLLECGAGIDGFEDYCETQGLEELAAQRATLVAAGGFSAPACLLDGEAFLGRQHLPLLRSKLLEDPR